jgi:hypothetical protein
VNRTLSKLTIKQGFDTGDNLKCILALARGLANNSSITSLTISGSLGIEAVNALIAMLEQNTTIIELNLKQCRIEVESRRKINAFLERNQKLLPDAAGNAVVIVPPPAENPLSQRPAAASSQANTAVDSDPSDEPFVDIVGLSSGDDFDPAKVSSAGVTQENSILPAASIQAVVQQPPSELSARKRAGHEIDDTQQSNFSEEGANATSNESNSKKPKVDDEVSESHRSESNNGVDLTPSNLPIPAAAASFSIARDPFQEMSDIDEALLSSSRQHKTVTVKKRMTDQEKMTIGKLGEQRALNFYRNKYLDKYGRKAVVDTVSGFQVQGKNKNGARKEIEYKWHNAEYDTDAAVDVVIHTKRNGVAQPERYIEVKATKELNKSPAHISRNQLKAMRKHRNKFTLFRAYDVQNDASIKNKKYKDPYKTVLGEPTLAKSIESITVKI